jgi:S-adenosylmethionine:tRNA ribosyltransferase-isomerase
VKTSDFWYDLPEELIAQTPIEPRDASRLLYYNQPTDEIKHLHFRDIVDILESGDVIVVNNTRVLHARLFGHDESGRKYEILLLSRKNLTDWEALLKPAKKAKIGTQIIINSDLKAEILGIDEDGVRRIRFHFEGVFEDILSREGSVPLPPYIKEELADKERYQTVYAKTDGSAAAPTAGLHFTPELMQRLTGKGVVICELLLHVGLGTFRPVKADDIEDHRMHAEYYEIGVGTARRINEARAAGKRVVAVGTTTLRVLESVYRDSEVHEGSGWTDIFIYPPYKIKSIDALLTNFHLPESTLLMLISALVDRQKILELYKTAVQERYRFFSFGDAMCLNLK